MRILLILYLANQPSVIIANILLKRKTITNLTTSECLDLFLPIWGRQTITARRNYQGVHPWDRTLSPGVHPWNGT